MISSNSIHRDRVKDTRRKIQGGHIIIGLAIYAFRACVKESTCTCNRSTALCILLYVH